MKIKLLTVALLLISLISVMSCNKTDQKYLVRITAYNGNFSGTYTIDGDEFGAFAGTLYNAQVYLWEYEVSISDNILIDVVPDPDPNDSTKSAASTVICRIYLSKDLVFDNHQTVSTTAPVTFKYEPGGTESSTTK